MMNSNNSNYEISKDQNEIPLIKFNQIESENESEAEWEENNHTEADSGIHQSIILLNNIEQKNKKSKGFKSFIEKPCGKNFLNGGDYSDFFNNRVSEEDDNSPINGVNNSNNGNSKKFHTVSINKQSSISSQLRGILNSKVKEEESKIKIFLNLNL